MLDQIIRGPLLIPSEDGRVAFFSDGALASDAAGIIQFAGGWQQLSPQLPAGHPPERRSAGTMLPPLLDIHTHIPQHPIRGRFADGIPDNPPGGRLLSALKRNVFPAEARCGGNEYTRRVVADFLADTLAHGIVGGAAFMTVSAPATEIALEMLPNEWSVGLVLMNQNTPDNLRTDEANLDADISRLAARFGRRLIVTDRFAVAVTSPLRKQAAALAAKFGLRTQTHLNEQAAEKQFVERDLYPHSASYTAVYRDDGLLDHQCILAHCIHQTAAEWPIITASNSVIAHCPTSNLLLGSGVMPLDCVMEKKIPFALGTDVGASPTVSMLAEMGRFLRVHAGKSSRATAAEALFRSTLAPANILGLDIGRLEPGRPMSFIELRATTPSQSSVLGSTVFDPEAQTRRELAEVSPQSFSTDDAIRSLLPINLDDPENSVRRVTLAGKMVFHA
jgi:guanine deaminase